MSYKPQCSAKQMANGTHSSRRAKDEENDNRRVKRNGEKEKINARPSVSEKTCLKRSPRETSSTIPSTLSTRKSERLEKRKLSIPAFKRKSERIDKRMPSGSRRSGGRTRSQSSSSPSDSKSSGSMSSRQKPKKEKSVRQLTFEAKKVNENEEHDLGTSQVKVRRMDARLYRSLFKVQKKEPNRIDKSNQGGNNGGGKIDECCKGSHSDCKEFVSKNDTPPSEDAKAKEMRVDSGLSDPVKDLVENNMAVGSLAPSDAATYESGLVPERIQSECCREETLHISTPSNSILDEDLTRNSVDPDRGEKSVPSKAKGTTVDLDSDVPATLAKGDSCNLIPDGSHSRPGGNVMVTIGPSDAATCETGLLPDSIQHDCCGKETLQMVASRNSIFDELDEDLVRKSVEHDKGENSVPSKRKGIAVDVDSDVSATLAQGGKRNLIPHCSPSRPCGHIGGVDGSCSKRIRLNYIPTLNEPCNPPATELQDGDDSDSIMMQKDSPASLVTDEAKNTCLICKSEGQLLFCGGKGCSGCYHPACLEPPLLDAPLGIWHCRFCVRKKVEFGVYSVSEGVESIFDVREVPSSNGKAEREFLVKYKGLAHVHNRWVPENQLLLEAPLMLMKFNQKDQTLLYKPEWSVPHRLLQKRALICDNQHDDHNNNHSVDNFGCCHEWLVKWNGLGYEHATWELDNASFFCTPEGQSLIRGYERRFQRAKRISSCSKLDKKTEGGTSVNKLSLMPGGVSSGFSNNNLDVVNKLREHWHKGQNTIVIDDHDRILKVAAFILSLHSDTYRPFLIVSTAASLPSWEDEFHQLDPSIDVIIYNGNKEIRNSIRRLEFYDEAGHCILFQVLIVVPEIIVEDMVVLGSIEWEAIIVDECQAPRISSYFKQIKILNTHFRVLLLRGQLKDNIVENINILALLDCQIDNEKVGLITCSNNIVQLKERLSSHIAYKCKSDSFRFVEYWVPVQISHVQLELYCSILLSHASVLRSTSKVDAVGAVRDVLISTQKCCSHPYVVNPDLQPLLHKGLEPIEQLDVDIKASGKLQLLDSMLTELREKALRVLILVQNLQFIGGSRKFSIGDYLDDLLQQRFGSDSYERIAKGLSSSTKQKAMKRFNDKNNGRFVFLLETCACLPSIKLSSVDCVIIYDSDWNPMNDIRSLQKITLDSELDEIKIFRLYSSFTVEEKALILARQDKTVDINLQIQSTTASTSHMLLKWGASCLFDELRIFHDDENSESNVKSFFGRPLLKEAMCEFSALISPDVEDIDKSNCSTLLSVQQNGGIYSANFPLLGELKLMVCDEEPPQFFWTKMLEGKQFRWKYLNSSSQRSRKKVHHFDGSVDGLNLVSEGIVKKRRKVSNNIVDQPSSKSEGDKLSTGIKAGISGDLVDRSQGNYVESETKCRQHDEQRSLHLLLKPEVTKLCDVLLLPDNVKSMVDNFLEYVMNNHHVNREPVSMLQAFQVSLIWTAASLLKHKLNHKASLILAKQYLNFDCKKEEVDYLYSMLRCLKKIFLHRTGNCNDTGSPKASESSNRAYSCTGAQEFDLFKKDMSKSIKEIRKKCERQLKKLCLMQEEEKKRLRAAIEDEKTDLEKRFRIESRVIQSCSPNEVLRMENLKVLNIEFQKRIEELKCQHQTRLKDLEETQLVNMQKFQDKEDIWVQDVKSWALKELSNIVASNNSVTTNDCAEKGTAVNRPSSMEPISDGDGVNEFLDRESSRLCEMASLSNDPENNALLNLRHQNSDGVLSSIPDGHVPVEVQETNNDGDTASVLEREVPAETTAINFTDCPKNATPLHPPSSMDEICGRGSPDVPGLVLSPSSFQAASSSDSLATISHSSPHLEQQTTNGFPLSISERDIPVIVAENSQVVADCHNNTEPLMSVVLVDTSTTLDQQDGAPKTMTELSHEISVSRSANVMDSREHVQQLSSVESSTDHVTSRDMQTSSEQAELVSSAADVVPDNQSNFVSLFMKPLEEVQQLPSAELPSYLDSTIFPLSSGVGHQSTVPNQDIVQPHTNSEIDSHSHEVWHSASNTYADSLMPGDVRMQSSDPRNLSTPLEYHTIQTETHSASRMLLHLCYDPLKNEIDRIRKVAEQTMKNYEDMKLGLKSDFEKDVEELRRKYDVKFQEVEVEFQQTQKALDTNRNIVRMNKFLADAFRSKCVALNASRAPGMQQGSSFALGSFQPSRQQSATRHSLLDGSSLRGGSATSPQNPSTTASSLHMVPPIRTGYSTAGILSNVSARLPTINSLPSSSVNVHASGEIRTPAPHLQPYRPSTSSPTLLHGTPSQTATTNIPAMSPSFSHGPPPLPNPMTHQSDSHTGGWSGSAAGLTTPNLPAMDLRVTSSIKTPNGVLHMSDLASVNLPRSGTHSSVLADLTDQASPDLVCLSDDD